MGPVLRGPAQIVSRERESERLLFSFLLPKRQISQLLDDKKVRPWYANREKLSRNPKVADAVIDAEEHEQTLTADLQCDGNVVEPEAPAEPKQKRAKAEKKAPASRRASLEEADKAEEGDVGSGESAQTIVFLKRALGKALLSNDSGETVSVLRQLTEQRPNEASIRKLELGKIATHLSSSDHPEVREAATELLRQLVSVFVVGKAKP